MKKTLIVIAGVLLAGLLLAQSSLTVSPGGTLASCPSPSAKALIFCNVAGDAANPDGAYVSANGASYFRVGQSQAGGVVTFNGRAGNVLPATGDYTYSQITGTPTSPTKLSCSTAQISTGSAGTLTASGCTFQ